MNIVSIEAISKSFDEKQLFSQISFGIEEGDRIGLIGVNGSGKSTLLKTVAGLVRPDEGTVTYRTGLTVEYLAQTPEFDPALTVMETVFPSTLQRKMEAEGLWSLESQAKAILTRLGINDFDLLMGALSGGQRKRVAMARALIQPAGLLILDEPTNHIDNDTVAWLEEYLAKFSGALLLVTHDRYFLDRVVNRTLELDGGKLYGYSGNYGDFLEQKAAREENDIAREDKRQNILRRELAWLRRGAKARSTKQKARIQRVEALQDDKPEAKGAGLEIAVGGHRLGKRIMEIKDVTKSFADRAFIKDFTYTVLQDDRIGIIGPNGSGKSTLLNLMSGRLAPDSGEVILGKTVRLAYYDQESGYMDPDQRVIDYIKEVAEVVRTPDGGTITASQMLERFLFLVRMQYTPIGKLSGGERRRLYLLRTLMSEPNVLLLDEPTNDLDVQTLTILEDYLDSFPGVVITVSHDRYFLDRTVDHLFVFEGEGRIRRYVGGYSDYSETRQAEEAARTPAPVSAKTATAAPAGDQKPRALKFTFKEQREFEAIEGEIAALEARVAELKAATLAAATDYGRLQELYAQQVAAEAELGRMLDRWAELTELAEAIEQAKTDRQGGRT